LVVPDKERRCDPDDAIPMNWLSGWKASIINYSK
jgi:hypothetical protein